MREIVEVSLVHFTCFMLDGDSKLWGNSVHRRPLLWEIQSGAHLLTSGGSTVETVNWGLFQLRTKARGCIHSPLVGLFADVIRGGTSAIDDEIDITPLGDVPEHGFSHRRTTDIT